MSHDYNAQRRETFQTFKLSKGTSLPKEAVVEFAFFIEEPAFERALRLAGFTTRREKDGETLIAAFGPMPVTPEAIWEREHAATEIALKHDFYPDGWELAE
jgi:hypothetical protein